MEREALLAEWEQEETEPFAGWDFSHLAGRWILEEPPWSYADRVRELMQEARSVLDLGTGGGERLLDLREDWPARVAATEGYAPNLALAAARLAPHRVEVKEADSNERQILPFDDSSFDLVISRHSSFGAAEVMRVLVPGGVFFTQQVHGRSGEDLQARFGAAPEWPYATMEYFAGKLATAGLQVTEMEEWAGKMVFADVGAIVYYLKATPWIVPEFSVATNLDALLGLHAQLEAGHELAFGRRLYILAARKSRR
jgi:SAM-dependent methyltransferase